MKIISKIISSLSRRTVLTVIVAVMTLTAICVIRPEFTQIEASITTPVRGVAGDTWADIVIGKPDFGTVSVHQTVNNKLFWSSGNIVDRTGSTDKLYTYDSNNNRILGINLATCLATPGNGQCVADIVIGQPNFNTSGCNGDSGFQNYPDRAPAANSTLCLQPEGVISVEEVGSGGQMDIDPQGNLYVVDFFNNRVLKYDSPFQQTGPVVASDVWGQDNFTSNLCNKGMAQPSATSLCIQEWTGNNNFTAGVDIDSQGNMWVTDNNNQRVLRYPYNSSTGTISKTADIVLGQSDFTSSGGGSALNKFSGPASVRINAQGWVYVADQGNNRVLVFENPAIGATARQFASSQPNAFALPQGLDFQPNRAGIWILNRNHRSIELWDETTQTKTLELGVRDEWTVLGDPAGSLGFDSAGNIYYSDMGGYYNKNDVIMYANPQTNQQQPDKSLFGSAKPGNAPTQSSLFTGEGVVVRDNQFIALDDSRIMYWDLNSGDPTDSLTNGQPADGVIIADGFTDISHTQCCTSIAADREHHLYVSRFQDDLPARIEIYDLPLTNNEQPRSAYISYPLPLLNTSQQITDPPNHVMIGVAAADDGSYLWVTDGIGSRALRIRNPLTNPVVDVVLGQANATATSCNRGAPSYTGATPESLCEPGSIALDRLNNVWVSDHMLEQNGNFRLLEYNASLFPLNTQSVIYGPAASKIYTDHATFQPAFDSANRMVVGFNPYHLWNPSAYPGVQSRWPAYYIDPLASNSAPDGFLSDFYSLQMAAAFDDYNNLYMGDLNRGHILIYKNPFGTTVSPTPTPTPGSGNIVIYAEGTIGADSESEPQTGPTMQLEIGGTVVQQWTDVRAYTTYNYSAPGVNPSTIKLLFNNDAWAYGDRNLRVDKIVIDGVTYQTEDLSTYSVGSLADGACGQGYRQSEWLNCNGYFHYAQSATPTPTNTPTPIPTNTPTPTPSDPTAPSVAITFPTDGSFVNRNTNVTILANATDNVGVTRVEFRVNNTLECTDTSVPYTCVWRVPGPRDRTYTLTATAYDAANNTAQHSVTVTSR